MNWYLPLLAASLATSVAAPEMRGRTEGVDFGVLQGRTRLDLAPEGLLIPFFDSRDERSLLATSGVPASDALRESARDPRFGIRVTLRDVRGFQP